MRPTQGQDDWKEHLIARAREKVLGLSTTPEENPRQLQDYGRAGTSTATRNNANLEECSSNSGPDPKRPCYIQQLDILDIEAKIDSKTALFHASEAGHLHVVQYLIGKGADTNTKVYFDEDVGNFETPLHSAVLHGHAQVAEYLIQNGAKINEIDGHGFTALHFASLKGRIEIVELLIRNKADVNIEEATNYSSLQVATCEGHLNIIEILIKNGAMINSNKGSNRQSPLHIAASNGSFDIVKYLVKNGAAVNQKDINKATPLHLAASGSADNEKREHIDIVEYLMQVGADVNVIDKNGCTPLFLAAQKGHQNIVKCLVTYGANLNITNSDMETPLYVAVKNGHLAAAETLTNNGAVKDVNILKSLSCLLGELNQKSQEITNLANENKLLKEKTSGSKDFNCHFCLKPTETSFMFDCGHLPFCEICSKTILERKVSKCSICNKLVGRRYLAYLDVIKYRNSKSESSDQTLIID